ncbi:hypothetical protein QOZ83_01235 [Romboutsia sedimentorum]|jgi:hypothetical protein|uniref:DUF6718 family protein n=1 Tax=Romboutsia sedimentorum TaxID=1368474 RepID=UPI00047C9053|nr:DUF6718 family protein [Romboutsia sedimentorum]MDK2584469.1 hypothetical protein [Romboutsia sedimentorum]
MCYLVVKKFSDQGCIVTPANPGSEVAGLSKFLSAKLSGTDKQVVTISDLDTWKEYEPFKIIENVVTFIDEAIKM